MLFSFDVKFVATPAETGLAMAWRAALLDLS
jgi:hypothetical protein